MMGVDMFNPDEFDIIGILVSAFIMLIFTVLGLILLFTSASILFIILSLIHWVWIYIVRFKFSISNKYFYYILFRIIIVEGVLLYFSLLNSSEYLTGLGGFVFSIAAISLLVICSFLVYNISQDRTIIKLIL